MSDIHIACDHNYPRILIVEDNSFNIIAVQAILEELNLKDYDMAMNGKLAVEKFNSKLYPANECKLCQRNNLMYSLILMDCNMPVMDGFQATRAIRSRVDSFNQRQSSDE